MGKKSIDMPKIAIFFGGKKDENPSDVAVNCLLLREPHLKPLTGSLDKYRQQLSDVYPLVI